MRTRPTDKITQINGRKGLGEKKKKFDWSSVGLGLLEISIVGRWTWPASKQDKENGSSVPLQERVEGKGEKHAEHEETFSRLCLILELQNPGPGGALTFSQTNVMQG